MIDAVSPGIEFAQTSYPLDLPSLSCFLSELNRSGLDVNDLRQDPPWTDVPKQKKQPLKYERKVRSELSD